MILPGNVLITGPVGSGKSWLAGQWLRRWARRGPLVVVDRSGQHAGLVGSRLVLDRDVVAASLDWDRLLADHERLLVEVAADPVAAWPLLDGLGDALYRAGRRRVVIEEAQRWTPRAARGARQLALMATDGRRRALDWLVVAPEVVSGLGGIAQEWLRESRFRFSFALPDPLQRGHLEALVPAWRGEFDTLRLLARDAAGGVVPGEYLVHDARSGRAARVDLAAGSEVLLPRA